MPLQNTIAVTALNTIQDKYVPITDQDTIALLIKKWNQNKAKTSDFWATLGRQDNASIKSNWSGNIVCSRVGNNSYTNRGRQIQQQALQLCSLYSTDTPDITTVYEKFIALKDLNLGTDANARKLQLTICVNSGEHALTFLQHTDLNDTQSKEGVFEFILPQTIDPAGKKNQLTYLFELPQTSVDGAFQTVIKVMSYKSVMTTASTLGNVKDILRKLDNPYGIKLFDVTQNKFLPIADPDIATKIDKNKKTLLFIHGTVSSIENSYGDLYDSEKSTAAATDHTWIQKAIFGGKKYEQVIGFDHPTVVDSAQDNANKLFSMLAPLGSFSKTIDIITSSRGGLVGKTIINAKQNIFVVERAATVACANGVELLHTAQTIGKMFSILAKINQEPISKAALVVMQMAFQVVLELPGIKIMRKDSDDLKTLLAGKPSNKNLRYMPLCGDYKLTGQHPIEWKFIDLLISGAMLDMNNDWVVETDFEVIVPDGFLAYQQTIDTYRSKSMDTTHLRYFYDPMNTKAKSRIFYFLHDTDVMSAKNLPNDF